MKHRLSDWSGVTDDYYEAPKDAFDVLGLNLRAPPELRELPNRPSLGLLELRITRIRIARTSITAR